MNYSLHGIVPENHLRIALWHVSMSIIDGLLVCKKYSVGTLAATDSVVSPKCDGKGYLPLARKFIYLILVFKGWIKAVYLCSCCSLRMI